MLIKGKSALFLLLLFSILILTGCNEKRKAVDVSNIKVNLKFLRFEQDLFHSDFEKISDSIPFFRKKYGEFFDIFNYKIIRIGSYQNPSYPDLLRGFITDYNMNQLFKTIDQEFHEIDSIKEKINDAFRYFSYFFPEKHLPVIITYFSGFNQSMVTADTILGIGLDKYLGSGCNYYRRLDLSQYQFYNMHKNKIPSDCIRAWAFTQFPMSDSSSNLLAHIIYEGKIMYFTKTLMPQEPDSLVAGMSLLHLEWCKKNEDRMWTYLVENKLLFKTDYMTINKFTGEGPFTKDFGRHSPSKAAIWVGWQIINSYINRHSEISLKSLMAENDFMKILRLSKYRP